MDQNNVKAAKQLTAYDIKNLPKASVIWLSVNIVAEEGVQYFTNVPMLVCASGEDGTLIGGNKELSWRFAIEDQMTENPDYTFWDTEPEKYQLVGISDDEYNNMPDEIEDNIYPALVTKITAVGWTIANFSEVTGLDEHQFIKTIVGNREFTQDEIILIRKALKLSDDEVMQIFFPEFVGRVFDINTGKKMNR